jgi:hypothetical protein
MGIEENSLICRPCRDDIARLADNFRFLITITLIIMG